MQRLRHPYLRQPLPAIGGHDERRDERPDLEFLLAARQYLYQFFHSLFGSEPTRKALDAYDSQLLADSLAILFGEEIPEEGAEICRRLGFSSPSVFSRFIRQQPGKSPRALRAAAGQAKARPAH